MNLVSNRVPHTVHHLLLSSVAHPLPADLDDSSDSGEVTPEEELSSLPLAEEDDRGGDGDEAGAGPVASGATATTPDGELETDAAASTPTPRHASFRDYLFLWQQLLTLDTKNVRRVPYERMLLVWFCMH